MGDKPKKEQVDRMQRDSRAEHNTEESTQVRNKRVDVCPVVWLDVQWATTALNGHNRACAVYKSGFGEIKKKRQG